MTLIKNEMKDHSKVMAFIERTQKEAEAEKTKALSKRITSDVPKKMFYALMESCLDKLLYQTGKKKGFVPDANAQQIFNYLYLYISSSKDFDGDLSKGILIAGNYGIGKTLIMTGFCNAVEMISQKRIHIHHAKPLAINIAKDHEVMESMSKGILFIDDLGKEPKSVNTFGTLTNPMEDLLSLRYERNALTFATGNLKLETYKEHYGGSIYDRMKSMFNILELKGASKR